MCSEVPAVVFECSATNQVTQPLHVSCDTCHVLSEEDVLGRKRKRMSIGESMTEKKPRLEMEDEADIGQAQLTKLSKQVNRFTRRHIYYIKLRRSHDCFLTLSFHFCPSFFSSFLSPNYAIML